MNEPNGSGAEPSRTEAYVLLEIRVTPDGTRSVEPTGETAPPAAVPPAQAPAQVLPQEPPVEEPPIVRHDPFAYMRGARWMDRKLSPSGRAAVLLRRDLEAFPVIEGRDPNHADLDAIVQRTVDYIVPIIRREQATDIVYEELEKRREERIAKVRQQPTPNLLLPDSFVDDPLPIGKPIGPESPNTEISASDSCAQIIDACQRQCSALFADKGREALPGSGRDTHGRYRRCVRECVAPSGCSY